MDTQKPEEVILKDAEVQQEFVSIPRQATNHGTGDSVEDEVVRRGDDGGENKGGIGHAGHDNCATLPRVRSEATNRDGGDGEADEERVSKMKRGHSSYKCE